MGRPIARVVGSRPDLAACLQARMEEARALFRNPDTTEFVIVTIPTVMAAAESARLAKALRTEKVPVKSILINQVCFWHWLGARYTCTADLQTYKFCFTPCMQAGEEPQTPQHSAGRIQEVERCKPCIITAPCHCTAVPVMSAVYRGFS